MRRLLHLLPLLALLTVAAVAEDQPPPAAPKPAEGPAATPAPAPQAVEGANEAKPPAPPAGKEKPQPKPPPASGKPAPVQLQNPGFEEEGFKGWSNTDTPEFAENFGLDGDNFHSGKRALHIQSQQPGQWPWISQAVPQVEPGMLYAVRVWFRGAEQSDSTAALKLEFRNEQNEVTGGRYVRRPLPVGMWNQMALQVEAPAGSVSAVLYLRLIGDGEAWFDDAEMIRSGAPAPLTALPARLALLPGVPQQVHLQVRAAAELPDPVEAKLTVTDPARKELKDVKGELARQDAHTLSGDIELPALTPGVHVWRVKLKEGQVEGRLYVTLPGDKRQPKYLTDKGFVQMETKPIFPIGMYHVSLADYDLLIERGFNAVQGVASQDRTVLSQALAAAKKAKLIVDVPLYFAGLVGANLDTSQKKLQAFAKDATISGWKIADEPDHRPEMADEVPEAYFRLKQKDSQRPLLLTVEKPETYEYWAKFCDALQVVCFPLPGQPLSMVADRVSAARKVLQPWQHLSVLLQAGWLPGGTNQPTLEQARTMVYLAVISGAQGIYWYSMRDPGWQLADSPLWEQFKKLNEETAQLGQIVSCETRAVIENDNPKIRVGAWSGGAVHVLVSNPENEPQTATIKLPQAAAKADVTQGRASVNVKDGALAVTLVSGDSALITVETAK